MFLMIKMLEMRGVLFLVLGSGDRGNGRLHGAFEIYTVGRSRGLPDLKTNPPQVVEGKEKTSLCRSLRVLICKLTLTLVGKIEGPQLAITFPRFVRKCRPAVT